MTTLYSPKRVVIFALFILNVRALDTFVAAVYEHAIILPNRMEKPVSKEEALLLMNKNIDILEDAVKLAAKQGAHIIVTPEDGIYGWSIHPYLENIPAPEYNLFAPEIRFDLPKDSEFVTFDTPFGKFGIFTCFDIFSHDPAVVVVDKLQADSVLYPTAWLNTLTSMHMTGSGIYAPEAVKVYHYDMETNSGRLMLAELKSRPRLELTYPAAVDWSAYARSVQPFPSRQSDFPGMIYFDEFTFTELKRDAGNYTVCQKDLCCHLTYKMSGKRIDEVYALGTFDGLHTVEGQYYLQICTTCGEPVGSAFTKFEDFSLSGTFRTSYVFPQIVLSGSQLVSRDGRLRSRSGAPLPVLVMALYGRVFEKDPRHLGQGPAKLQ
uniref:Vanin C-terminal domain-containing protein n=1 Tax=Cavia porcellus TaxID=10141 RepID=A0A286XTE0_CAVPO